MYPQKFKPVITVRKNAKPFVGISAVPQYIGRRFGPLRELEFVRMFTFGNDEDIGIESQQCSSLLPESHITIPGDDLHGLLPFYQRFDLHQDRVPAFAVVVGIFIAFFAVGSTFKTALGHG